SAGRFRLPTWCFRDTSILCRRLRPRGDQPMKARSCVLTLLFAWAIVPAAHAEWKPAQAPLMTKWAKDVTPDKVLPEYPRPQLVREKWQNLNGLWQFAVAKEKEEPPVGKKL